MKLQPLKDKVDKVFVKDGFKPYFDYEDVKLAVEWLIEEIREYWRIYRNDERAMRFQDIKFKFEQAFPDLFEVKKK